MIKKAIPGRNPIKQNISHIRYVKSFESITDQPKRFQLSQQNSLAIALRNGWIITLFSKISSSKLLEYEREVLIKSVLSELRSIEVLFDHLITFSIASLIE